MTLSLSNNGPAGTFEFNVNDAATRVRVTSTDIITYGLSTSGAARRVAFTAVGPNAGQPGYIVTGHLVDGGGPGSGLDLLSGDRADADRDGRVLRRGTGSEVGVVVTPSDESTTARIGGRRTLARGVRYNRACPLVRPAS